MGICPIIKNKIKKKKQNQLVNSKPPSCHILSRYYIEGHIEHYILSNENLYVQT